MFESICNDRLFLSVFVPETVLSILPISPYDVISCLHPFGPQDKKNGRSLKIEEAEKLLFCTSHDGPTRSVSFNPRVPSGTDKTRNKTEEKQEITF